MINKSCLNVIGVAVLLFAVQSSTAMAQPTNDAQKRADTLFAEGQRFLASKEYAVACTAFEQSQALDPAIGTQLNIALCYQQWGRIAAAYKAFVEAARIANKANDERGPGATLRANELKPKVPRLTLIINADADPASAIFLDGKELSKLELVDILVEPGNHKIDVRAPGQAPVSTDVTLELGARQELALHIPAQIKTIERVEVTTKRSRVIVGWTLMGVGAVTLGVAGYVSLVARQDYRNAFAGNCDVDSNTCNDLGYDGTSSARRRANISSFVAAGGLALATTGVVLLLTGRSKKTRDSSAWYVLPSVTEHAGGLAFGAAF
jgi:tetratricopeptide (TPR) repeat protein